MQRCVAIFVPPSEMRFPQTIKEIGEILTESKKKCCAFLTGGKNFEIFNMPFKARCAPRKFLKSLDEARRTGYLFALKAELPPRSFTARRDLARSLNAEICFKC